MGDEEARPECIPTANVKKPVPLPRKNMFSLKSNCDSIEEDAIYANGVPDCSTNERKDSEPLSRRGSRTFQEKIRMRNEVQRLEKSFRKMMPKRRSVVPKGNKTEVATQPRCNSLPDNNIFDNISFNSPFGEGGQSQRVHLVSGDSDETSSDTESFYTTSELPPSYPPPPLPDESTYDELTSASSEGPNSYYSPGSDSNSIYEELSNYLSLSLEKPKSDVKAGEASRSDSWSFYDAAASASGSRYEEIDEFPEPEMLIPKVPSPCEMRRTPAEKPSQTQTNSVVLQFDPLFDKASESWEGFCNKSASAAEKDGLSLNPFADPVILSFLTDEEDKGLYGNINKNHDSVLSDCEHLNFEIPTTSGPPPVPPRRFDSVSAVTAESEDAPDAASKPPKDPEKRSSVIRWSSMKRVARFVADNIESSGLGRKQEKKGLLGKSLSQENVMNEEAEGGRSSLYSNDGEDLYVPLVLHHSGVLYRPGGLKRWGVLAQRKLTIFANKDSPDVKETLSVDSILSLRLSADNKIR